MMHPEERFYANLIILARLLAIFLVIMLVYALSQSEYIPSVIIIILAAVIEFLIVPLLNRRR